MIQNKHKAYTCCFTGHREIPPNHFDSVYQKTYDTIIYLIENKGVKFFGVGGAIGYDTLASDILFKIRDTLYPHIKIILVFPFEGFINKWNNDQKQHYYDLLPKYDKTVCVNNFPSRDAYFKRNRHLVDYSMYCICYCTRNTGGTAYTVSYAQQNKLYIYNVK